MFIKTNTNATNNANVNKDLENGITERSYSYVSCATSPSPVLGSDRGDQTPELIYAT